MQEGYLLNIPGIQKIIETAQRKIPLPKIENIHIECRMLKSSLIEAPYIKNIGISIKQKPFIVVPFLAKRKESFTLIRQTNKSFKI